MRRNQSFSGKDQRRAYLAAIAVLMVLFDVSSARAGTGADTQPTTFPTTAPKLSIDPADSTMPVSGPGTRPIGNMLNMSIEDLMNIEIFSAAKQKRRLADSAAAVSVITQEDIARSHYQSIPELLRMAPGMNIEQLNASTWTAGTRGFSYQFTDSLLVMVDGRSVYSPVSSGVYWNTVDYILADIDRIEIVRSPGAALWGANAVNGVVNIITKEAKDTQGLLWDSYTGTDGYINSVRYGGELGDVGFFRVYAKQRSMDDFMYDPANPNVGSQAMHGDAHDGWDQQRAGFRADLTPGGSDTLTIQGDFFNSRVGGHVTNNITTAPFKRVEVGPYDSTGGNVLARWTHAFSDTSDLTVQLYVDNANDPANYNFGYDSTTVTTDLDFQHHFLLGGNHDITWGGDYRFLDIHSQSNPDTMIFTRSRDMLHDGSLFGQDDITLIPDRLHFIASGKLEYFSLAAEPIEFQPSLRLLWTPDAHNTIWAAVSRSARNPNLVETEVIAPLARSATREVVRYPNPDIHAIIATAYEAGYRTEMGKNLSLDMSAFYYNYDHRRDSMSLPPIVGPSTEIRSDVNDRRIGQSWGGELAATWQVSDQFSLRGSYSYVDATEFRGIKSAPRGPSDPQNQVKLRGHLSISKEWSADTELYWIDRQLNLGPIPSYWRWDASVTWKACQNAELSAGVWNLLDNSHVEGFDNLFSGVQNEVPRTFFVQLQVRF